MNIIENRLYKIQFTRTFYLKITSLPYYKMNNYIRISVSCTNYLGNENKSDYSFTLQKIYYIISNKVGPFVSLNITTTSLKEGEKYINYDKNSTAFDGDKLW